MAAKENCQSLNGILWEPKNLDEMEKVKSKAFELNEYGRWWWIGITDTSIEGIVYIQGVPPISLQVQL